MSKKNENPQSAVEWFYDKIKSHFEHDGDLLESLTFTMSIAKKKECDLLNDAIDFGVNIEFGNIERDYTITQVEQFLGK